MRGPGLHGFLLPTALCGQLAITDLALPKSCLGCQCPLTLLAKEGVGQSHNLGAHLHPTPPASSSLAQAVAKALSEAQGRDKSERAACPVLYVSLCFRQSSHPGAKSIQLFTDAFL